MSQPLLEPRRVVIGAGAHVELANQLRALRADLEIRGDTYMNVTTDDLEWGDTYIGFKRPPLATMGNIRWVHCTGAGVDAWLSPDALPRDILLTRTSEPFGPMIAEWALARALAFKQQLLDLADCQRRHEWTPRDVSYIRGTTAVVVGTGEVGISIGRLFNALGCTVHGVSRTGGGDPTVFATTSTIAAVRDLLPSAHWLILAIPLTQATRGLIGRDFLSACRRAVLLNAGRGAVLDEASLPDALDNGWISGAALDVFEVEPLPTASPLWSDPRVMISPHMSGLTTIEGAIIGFVECLGEIDRGERPKRTVDRERQY